MAPGLGEHAVAGVDEDDRQLAGRRARDHVAGVLLVAGRVGDDELAPGRGEVPVGDVDGDALLALGLEPVGEQRQVEVLAGVADGGGVLLQRGEMILVDHLRVVQQPPDQRGLAVVDAAARQEPQQVLALVLGEVGVDVGRDEVALVGH